MVHIQEQTLYKYSILPGTRITVRPGGSSEPKVLTHPYAGSSNKFEQLLKFIALKNRYNLPEEKVNTIKGPKKFPVSEHIYLSNITLGELIDKLLIRVSHEDKLPLRVSVINTQSVAHALRNIHFRKIIKNSWVALPDGKQVAKYFSRVTGNTFPETKGSEILPKILGKLNEQNLLRVKPIKVFFYGDTEETLNKISTRMKTDYPLVPFQTYSPPFRELDPLEDLQITNMIEQSGADILFVSLGCPKQELWMEEHSHLKLVQIGIGAAFRWFSGDLYTSPKELEILPLEHIHRFLKEPKRVLPKLIDALLGKAIMKKYEIEQNLYSALNNIFNPGSQRSSGVRID